jgi:ABC-type Fe3+-hydroxamate transport system substrate-binding protein
MRTSRFVVLLSAVLFSACGDDGPTTPSTPACERNNTATITLQNRNASNLTYDVYVDAGRVAVLAPGQDSSPQTVAAGVQHSVIWYYTNTSLQACFVNPIPVRCSTQAYFCSF